MRKGSGLRKKGNFATYLRIGDTLLYQRQLYKRDTYICSKYSVLFFLMTLIINTSVTRTGNTSGLVVLQYNKATDSPLFEYFRVSNSPGTIY